MGVPEIDARQGNPHPPGLRRERLIGNEADGQAAADDDHPAAVTHQVDETHIGLMDDSAAGIGIPRPEVRKAAVQVNAHDDLVSGREFVVDNLQHGLVTGVAPAEKSGKQDRSALFPIAAHVWSPAQCVAKARSRRAKGVIAKNQETKTSGSRRAEGYNAGDGAARSNMKNP
jgi:hypothetical protein